VQGHLLDIETKVLVQRWIIAFSETPILIDAELMRRVLSDHEARLADAARVSGAGCRSAG